MPDDHQQVRAFIAIELPHAAREGLARLEDALRRPEHRCVRWVSPEGIHLTLKFLGNIPAARVREIGAAVEEAARDVPPFRLEVAGTGVFPGPKQVRVFWVGIGGEMDRLCALQGSIDSALATLGFAREDRPFVPHLTLARVRQGAPPGERRSFGELVDSVVFEEKHGIEVRAVSLMRSRLTPAGAVYTRLSSAELGGRS